MKFFIYFIIGLFFISLIGSAINPNKKQENESNWDSMTYERLRNSSVMYDVYFREIKQTDYYKNYFSYVSEQCKLLWPNDYDRRQKEIQNCMCNFEEKIFDQHQEIAKKAKADKLIKK